ncbi:MAG: hypothetical protein KF768_09990 [Phycisphaeraceae bacterium]|nr:hypothetical protein [Phycisphaeraceae bacterium]
MSQASAGAETAKGYSPPSVTQFSVFLDNRVGQLHELLRVFETAPINLCALSVHDASDCAVVRLITSNSDETRRILRKHEFPFGEFAVLVVELHRGQTLERMCLYLLTAELNIRFAYPLISASVERPRIAIAVDDGMLAGQILMRKEFRLLGEADLCRSDLA